MTLSYFPTRTISPSSFLHLYFFNSFNALSFSKQHSHARNNPSIPFLRLINSLKIFTKISIPDSPITPSKSDSQFYLPRRFLYPHPRRSINLYPSLGYASTPFLHFCLDVFSSHISITHLATYIPGIPSDNATTLHRTFPRV